MGMPYVTAADKFTPPELRFVLTSQRRKFERRSLPTHAPRTWAQMEKDANPGQLEHSTFLSENKFTCVDSLGGTWRVQLLYQWCDESRRQIKKLPLQPLMTKCHYIGIQSTNTLSISLMTGCCPIRRASVTLVTLDDCISSNMMMWILFKAVSRWSSRI